MPIVVLFDAAGGWAAGSGGRGGAGAKLEPTIAVDAATTSATAPAVSATTLQAGQRYLLVVNGTYTESFPTTDGGTFTYFNDGVYCFDENPSARTSARGGCAPAPGIAPAASRSSNPATRRSCPRRSWRRRSARRR